MTKINSQKNKWRCDHCKKWVSIDSDCVLLPEGEAGDFAVCAECEQKHDEIYWSDWMKKQKTGSKTARKQLTDFERALRDIPKFVGGFDPHSHKTVEDLAYLVAHEWDLITEEPEEYMEGNEVNKSALTRRKKACEKYLDKWQYTKLYMQV